MTAIVGIVGPDLHVQVSDMRVTYGPPTAVGSGSERPKEDYRIKSFAMTGRDFEGVFSYAGICVPHINGPSVLESIFSACADLPASRRSLGSVLELIEKEMNGANRRWIAGRPAEILFSGWGPDRGRPMSALTLRVHNKPGLATFRLESTNIMVPGTPYRVLLGGAVRHTALEEDFVEVVPALIRSDAGAVERFLRGFIEDGTDAPNAPVGPYAMAFVARRGSHNRQTGTTEIPVLGGFIRIMLPLITPQFVLRSSHSLTYPGIPTNPSAPDAYKHDLRELGFGALFLPHL